MPSFSVVLDYMGWRLLWRCSGKEVGIRKILEATVGQIVSLFTREFIWLVGIAFVLATPLAWYLVHKMAPGLCLPPADRYRNVCAGRDGRAGDRAGDGELAGTPRGGGESREEFESGIKPPLR